MVVYSMKLKRALIPNEVWQLERDNAVAQAEARHKERLAKRREAAKAKRDESNYVAGVRK